MNDREYPQEIPVRQYTDKTTSLAGLDETGPGQAMIEATEKKIAELRNIVENKPENHPTDLKKTVAFKLGMIHMAHWQLALPREARRTIKDAEEAE